MQKFNQILLTGVNGQVGHELILSLAPLGKVHALDRNQLDLTNADSIRRVIRDIKPDLIVNPAAYTAVDKAESEPELAYLINAIAPGVMAEEAASLGIPMVHYSTDYVYDGNKSEPYLESDPTNPLSVYGKSKLAGEEAIRASGASHLILRTSWVYGARGKNFMKTILRLASEREQLRIVADQFGAPTTSHAIAEATARVLARWELGISGTYHFTCAGYTSWYGFAQAIIDEYIVLSMQNGWPELRVASDNIYPITTFDYPTPAVRPKNSRLECGKLKNDFGVELGDWKSALKDAVSQLKVD